MKIKDVGDDMRNEIKWLFFDLGSTLVDESKCLKERFDIIVKSNGIDEREFKKKILEFAETDCHAIKPAARFYGAEIPEWNKSLECLYPDVNRVLAALSEQFKLGIIANQSAGTQERIDDWGIGKYFDVVVASAEEGCEKPDLKIFELALKRGNCNPENAVMIGDRLDNDIVPAKKLGMKTVWVRQCFAKYQTIHNDSEKPDYIIESIGEIINIFSD